LTFLIDENAPVQLAKFLSAVYRQHKFEYVREKFHPGITDEQWLRNSGKRFKNPVAVSGDSRIVNDRGTLAALDESKLSFVLLRYWNKQKWTMNSWVYAKAWPQVIQNIEDNDTPVLTVVRFNPNREFSYPEVSCRSIGKLRKKRES